MTYDEKDDDIKDDFGEDFDDDFDFGDDDGFDMGEDLTSIKKPKTSLPTLGRNNKKNEPDDIFSTMFGNKGKQQGKPKSTFNKPKSTFNNNQKSALSRPKTSEPKKNNYDYDDLFKDDDLNFEDSYEKTKPVTKKAPVVKKEEPLPVEDDINFEDSYGGFDDDDVDDDWGEIDNSIDYNTKDLNKLSRKEVEKHKEIMTEDFSKNQVKPGDAGY